MRVEHDLPVAHAHHQVGETHRAPVQCTGCGYGLAASAGGLSFAGQSGTDLCQSAAGARCRQTTPIGGSPPGERCAVGTARRVTSNGSRWCHAGDRIWLSPVYPLV